jgi:hypothetical protein
MYRVAVTVAVLSLCGCANTPPAAAPKPPPPVDTRGHGTRDMELEREVGQLELKLMERDALVESLNMRLEQALQEVVSAMGKLRSLATRAEAASAMGEADVALQAAANSGRDSPETRQASRLMKQSASEFKRKNFGGALYLANQAKAAVRIQGLGVSLGNLRSGEVPFAIAVKLRTSARANVRTGPSMSFPVSYTAEAGAPLSGLSYLGDWVRVTNESGNEGWISRTLVARRAEPIP